MASRMKMYCAGESFGAAELISERALIRYGATVRKALSADRLRRTTLEMAFRCLSNSKKQNLGGLRGRYRLRISGWAFARNIFQQEDERRIVPRYLTRTLFFRARDAADLNNIARRIAA